MRNLSCSKEPLILCTFPPIYRLSMVVGLDYADLIYLAVLFDVFPFYFGILIIVSANNRVAWI
jgi:hypothetical protein